MTIKVLVVTEDPYLEERQSVERVSQCVQRRSTEPKVESQTLVGSYTYVRRPLKNRLDLL